MVAKDVNFTILTEDEQLDKSHLLSIVILIYTYTHVYLPLLGCNS
jgi:hypothetical protein